MDGWLLTLFTNVLIAGLTLAVFYFSLALKESRRDVRRLAEFERESLERGKQVTELIAEAEELKELVAGALTDVREAKDRAKAADVARRDALDALQESKKAERAAQKLSRSQIADNQKLAQNKIKKLIDRAMQIGHSVDKLVKDSRAEHASLNVGDAMWVMSVRAAIAFEHGKDCDLLKLTDDVLARVLTGVFSDYELDPNNRSHLSRAIRLAIAPRSEPPKHPKARCEVDRQTVELLHVCEVDRQTAVGTTSPTASLHVKHPTNNSAAAARPFSLKFSGARVTPPPNPADQPQTPPPALMQGESSSGASAPLQSIEKSYTAKAPPARREYFVRGSGQRWISCVREALSKISGTSPPDAKWFACENDADLTALLRSEAEARGLGLLDTNEKVDALLVDLYSKIGEPGNG